MTRPVGTHRYDRTAMRQVLGKLKKEFIKVLPPTLFFFVALHIVAVVRVLLAKGGVTSRYPLSPSWWRP